MYRVCIPPKKSVYLALAVIRTIPRTGHVPPGLLVGALPCGEYETRSHPGDFQSEPTWFASFCAWLRGRTVRCARAVHALCARCAKRWLFSTTGSSVSSEDWKDIIEWLLQWTGL